MAVKTQYSRKQVTLLRKSPIVDSGLVFDAPIWHSDSSLNPFATKDATKHSGTVSGATWAKYIGTNSPVTIYDPGAGHGHWWGNAIKLANGDLLRCGAYDSASLKIYKSTDSGSTWALLSTVNVTATYAMISSILWLRPNGDVWLIYVERIVPVEANYYTYLRVSTDSGATWGNASAILAGYDGANQLANPTPPILMSNGKLALPLCYEKDDLSLLRSVLAVYDFDTTTWTGYAVASDTTIRYNEWSVIETDTSGTLVGLLRAEQALNGHFYRTTCTAYGTGTWTSPTQNYATGNTAAAAWQDTPHIIKVGGRVYLTTWYRRFVDGADPVDTRVLYSDDACLTWTTGVITNQSQVIASGHGGGSTVVHLGGRSFLQTWHFSYTTHGATYASKVFVDNISSRCFDGVNDGIWFPDSSVLDITGGLTILAWFDYNMDATGGILLIKREAGVASTEVNYGLDFANAPITLRLLFYASAGWRTANGTTAIPSLAWTFGGVTFLKPDVVFYYNGATDGTASLNFDLVANTRKLFIGKNDNDIAPTKMSVGEVWVYNRVLTAAEVKKIYLATKWRYGL